MDVQQGVWDPPPQIHPLLFRNQLFPLWMTSAVRWVPELRAESGWISFACSPGSFFVTLKYHMLSEETQRSSLREFTHFAGDTGKLLSFSPPGHSRQKDLNPEGKNRFRPHSRAKVEPEPRAPDSQTRGTPSQSRSLGFLARLCPQTRGQQGLPGGPPKACLPSLSSGSAFFNFTCSYHHRIVRGLQASPGSRLSSFPSWAGRGAQSPVETLAADSHFCPQQFACSRLCSGPGRGRG